mgnify:CR=1 FL=1|tara:strand:+ start:2633 stop:4045 length:1413 start_codon:yes stop_codon:yes gene_type:complete
MKYRLWFFIYPCILYLFHNSAPSQEIPIKFYESQYYKLLYDVCENWDSHTLLGSTRFQDTFKYNVRKKLSKDSLNIHNRAGVYIFDNSKAIYGFSHSIYKRYYYGYLYPIIVDNSSLFLGYTGIPKEGFFGGSISMEMSKSGIGFQNDWLTLQYSRGNESWGAGNDIQLALSEKSASYDYVTIGSNFGNLRAKYIHGYLETTSTDINRYMTARGIEWSNLKSLIIALSEIIIYSGKNRPIDIGYLNPISSHLEIELNDRLNITGDGHANAVWQISIDWSYKKKLRLSGNFLYDEFVIDNSQKIEGKENGKAYSLKLAYTPIKSNKRLITLSSSLIHIGTPTFRHRFGFNNFVQRNIPLGWEHGSDGQELNFGLNYFNRLNLTIFIKTGILQVGEESITTRVFDSYKDYIKGDFPSGINNSSRFIDGELQWWWKSTFSFLSGFNYRQLNDSQWDFNINMGVNIFLPFTASL